MGMFTTSIHGEREITFELTNNMEDKSFIPNYINSDSHKVDLPIFCIHGNHDYLLPVNDESIHKLFSVSRKINYFGKQKIENNRLKFRPLCFRKGQLGIALYGLGHINDSYLRRILQHKHYDIIDPPDLDELNYIRILILHQNRFKGFNKGVNDKNSIEESQIPSKFDLVIWGHEHDCHTSIKSYSETRVYQPGSSISTSLTKGESIPKEIGIICWDGKQLFMEKSILLKSQRYMEFEDIEYDLLMNRVNQIVDERRDVTVQQGVVLHFMSRFQELEKRYLDSPLFEVRKLPLVRFRIKECPDLKDLPFDYIKLNDSFLSKTANNNIFHFVPKRKSHKSDRQHLNQTIERMKMDRNSTLDDFKSVFKEYLDTNSSKFKIVSPKLFADAIFESADTDSIVSKSNLHGVIKSYHNTLKSKLKVEDSLLSDFFRSSKNLNMLNCGRNEIKNLSRRIDDLRSNKPSSESIIHKVKQELTESLKKMEDFGITVENENNEMEENIRIEGVKRNHKSHPIYIRNGSDSDSENSQDILDIDLERVPKGVAKGRTKRRSSNEQQDIGKKRVKSEKVTGKNTNSYLDSMFFN